MLDDRPYMRPEEPRFRGPSMQQPWTGWAILLTINVVVFLLQVLIDPNSLATQMATFEKSFVGQWHCVGLEPVLSWLTSNSIDSLTSFCMGAVWHLFLMTWTHGLFFLSADGIGAVDWPSGGHRPCILSAALVGALFVQLGFAAAVGTGAICWADGWERVRAVFGCHGYVLARLHSAAS